MTNTIKSSVNNQESANLIVHTAAATAGPTAIAGHADTATTSKSSNNRVAMEVGSASEGAVVERANSTAASSIAVTLINVPVDSTSSATPVTSTGGTTMKKARSKTASPTRQGPQQCQVCSKVFGNASALAKHKLTHSDERKYVCGMCSKAFKRQDHLNGHMLTHRNKKPFECKAEGCGKSYCDARSLRRHTENHHSPLALAPTAALVSKETGHSLSPATANGDASSPHGATWTSFAAEGTSRVSFSSSSSSCSSLSPSAPSSPKMATSNLSGNEGLTRQQLDLISQIMQQTQGSAVLVSAKQMTGDQKQRVRTWNLQNPPSQTTATSTALGGLGGREQETPAPAPELSPKNQEMENQLSRTGKAKVSGGGATAASPKEQLTFTNPGSKNSTTIEQKPVECNLCQRKFKNVPALNGHMRLHGGYFKKESEAKRNGGVGGSGDRKEASGPPLQTASIGVRALIEEKIISKRSKELKAAAFVLPPTTPSSSSSSSAKASERQSPQLTIGQTAAAAAGVHLNGSGTTATKLLHRYQEQRPVQLGRQHQITTQTIQIPISSSNTASGQSIFLDKSKDATLIELLKRGTRVALKQTHSDPQQILLTTTTSSNGHPLPSPGQQTLSAILQQQSGKGAEVESSGSVFFNQGKLYNVNDTAILLQTMDGLQLIRGDEEGGFALPHDSQLPTYDPVSTIPLTLPEFSPPHSKEFVLCDASPAIHTQHSRFLAMDPSSDSTALTTRKRDMEEDLATAPQMRRIKTELEEQQTPIKDTKSILMDAAETEKELELMEDLSFLDDYQSLGDVSEDWTIPSPSENDLYLLHMLSHSDDPLLSSSPKDFDEQLFLPELGLCL